MNKMKEYSKDDRNSKSPLHDVKLGGSHSVVWIVMKEEQDKARKAYAQADAQKQQTANEQKAARQAEIRRELDSES